MMKMSSTSDRWSVTRNEIRDAVGGLIAASPNFRGRGRMTLILDRLLTDPVNPDSYITTGELNDGSRFVFDLRPWGQKFAYYYRNWERDHVRTLRRLYKGGAFLDAGSSLGIFVVGMGNAVSEHGGRILSFEPVPFNLERQRVNISLNGLQDVVDIFPFALGASGGVLRLTTDPLMADNNAFVTLDGNLEVPVRSLDEVARTEHLPRIGMMKMDVEGYEPAVLVGAEERIEKDRPILFAEFNRERMEINRFEMSKSWEFLRSLGYECHRLEGGRLRQLREPGEHENVFFLPAVGRRAV